MKSFIYLGFLLLITGLHAQDATQMQIVYGVEDKLLQGVLNFENISINQVKLSGPSISGKHYQLILKEYIKGNLKETTVLFDSAEADFFKIDKDAFQFNVISKITERNEFKIELQFNGFSSKKYYFPLKSTDYPYALKDFLGEKNEVEVAPSRFNILALITPTIHADGSASYCEVAQSGVEAKDLGKVYDMPQNFILEMKLK